MSDSASTSLLQQTILWAVRHVVTRPRWLLGVAGLVLAVCVLAAKLYLPISSDQNKLFSPRARFFADYLSFIEKFPENEAIYIVVQGASPARDRDIPIDRWTGIADELTAKLRTRKDVVAAVDSHVPAAAMGPVGLAFDTPENVRKARSQAEPFMQLVRLWGEKPGLAEGLLGSTPTARFLSGLTLAPVDADPARFAELLAGSWRQTLSTLPASATSPVLPDLARLDATDPSRLGYYYLPDDTDKSRSLLLVRVYPELQHTKLTAVPDTVDAIRDVVRTVAKEYPEFSVGVTGRPTLEADELRTTDHDSMLSEILALSGVFVGLVVMLRSVYLALVAEVGLAVGIGWTFGWATLSVGELNLLSIVFLIALIGIGMDYLVQVLSRYREEIDEGQTDPVAIWESVFRYVGPPINTACVGAAGAFLVSLASDFRGAAHLGVIAGGGLLLCLLSGYTVIPALLTVLGPPRRRPLAPSIVPATRSGPRAWYVGPAVWLTLLAVGVPLALRTRFDPGLIELQAQGLESVQLVRKLQTWSGVVMSRDLNTLRKARDLLAGEDTVASTDSLLNAQDNRAYLRAHPLPAVQWTPPTPPRPGDLEGLASRAQALADKWQTSNLPEARSAAGELAHVAGMLRQVAAAGGNEPERAAAALAAWQQGFVDLLRDALAQFSPPDIDPARLPAELRSHYVSADGTYALYIYPRHDLWNRAHLDEFVTRVEARLAPLLQEPASTGGAATATFTGIAPNIQHSTASIAASFYRSTGLALALIVVLVYLDLRRVRLTLAAVSVLALGLPMLVAVMGLTGVNWNFANFFALPILIGAGHEYGVFMVHRYIEAKNHPDRAWGRWDVADKALLMCAYVTTISFGFFWLIARHEGLKSLGFVMAAGTICIYVATVVAVRPILKHLLKGTGRHDDMIADASQEPALSRG